MGNFLPEAVLKNTSSEADLYRRLDMLKRFFENLFFQEGTHDGDRADLLRTYSRESDAETRYHAGAIAAWGDDILNGITAANLYDRLSELGEVVHDVPKLTLYVPVHFGPAHIERIGSWCRTHVHPNVLLDMRVDSSAVGGCKFAYNNAFADMSLSHYLESTRPQLTRIIQTYGA